jgi:cytidine deaminase
MTQDPTPLPADPADAALVAAARAAMAHAHAPYSRFAVGAAVRLTDGTVITGANLENASYGLSLCAETVAIASVNAQGRLADIAALAVAGGAIGGDGRVIGSDILTPCGRCRQIINEAEQMGVGTIRIICAAAQGDAIEIHGIAELLPRAFGPANLGIAATRNS